MIGVELLDDPHAEPSAVRHALRDIARLNALFGGTHAVVRELEPLFERRERETGNGKQETWTLLDVGAGSGDIARAIADHLCDRGLIRPAQTNPSAVCQNGVPGSAGHCRRRARRLPGR